MEFIILNSQDNEYQKIVLYLTTNSFFNNLKSIAEELKKIGAKV